jgi:hypothetical protein
VRAFEKVQKAVKSALAAIEVPPAVRALKDSEPRARTWH